MNPLKRAADRLISAYGQIVPHFRSDGLSVSHRNMGFLNDMAGAWSAVEEANRGLPSGVPDIRWRAHIAIWAAKHAMHLDGDLVECGVFTGILATAICNSIADFKAKKYWLFDTYAGVPLDNLDGSERRNAEELNSDYLRVDAEQVVRRAVGHFPHVRIVKGILPGSLAQADIDKISYLSVDLNNTPAEMAVIERLWGRIVPGAPIVLDDYGFAGHSQQYSAWNAFCRERGVTVATLPTGQGLIIKPPT